jgi:hypothetical protein
MVNRVQTLRSSVPGTAPAPGTRQPGELYVNFPDNALGVIDPTQNPVDLIPVRYFSSLASYFTGDCVLQNGRIYVATGIFGPGPFNPADWNVVTMATDLALYMPLSGGTFTGVVRFPANNSVVINGAAASQPRSDSWVEPLADAAGGLHRRERRERGVQLRPDFDERCRRQSGRSSVDQSR